MSENFQEFYEDFYQDQFDWYDDKAANNKKYYRAMKAVEIALAAALPIVATLFAGTSEPIWRWAIIAFAALLIIVEALEWNLNYQKKWMNYRTTAEGLRREEYMYKMGTGEYDGADDPERLFAERVLALTSRENRYWELTTRKAQEA